MTDVQPDANARTLLHVWIPPNDPSSAHQHDIEKSPHSITPTITYYPSTSGSTKPGWFRLSRHLGWGGGGLRKRLGMLFIWVGVVVVCVVLIARGRQSHVKSRYGFSTVDVPKKVHPKPYPIISRPPAHRPSNASSIEHSVGGVREIDASSAAMPLEAGLLERLDVWENAPGGRGDVEGEAEIGTFVNWNLEQCENVWPNHNKDLIHKARDIWATMTRSKIRDIRLDLIDHLRQAYHAGQMDAYGHGRGIVMQAGNADTFRRVLYTMKVMRNVYGSTLPVQVYHFPSERPDPNDPLIVELKALGVEMVEAIGTDKDPSKTKNYHLKAIAVVQSPWREVLFLDSDNIPTKDPEYMFDSAPYKRLGFFAWPDYWKTGPSNPIWQIMGVKCRNEWEMEAGQILVDKKRHLDAMILSRYMLANHHFWFNFSDGDKDIFRFAFLSLRKRFAVPGRYVGVGGLPSGTASGSFCGLTMQQYDHEGQPLFIHYNLLKQVPSGVHRGFSWGRTMQFPLFTDSDQAREEGVRGLGDIDNDMLADADDEGNAISPASWEVRKRAALERGARPFFHGGFTSALCISFVPIMMRLDDPRPDSAREADDHAYALAKENDPSTTMRDLSPLGIEWGENVLEVAQWKDDERLRDFEKNVYDQGFIPNGKGF